MKRGYQMAAGLAALLLAGTVQAHTFGSHGAGFAAGLAHPFSGIDHWLAMIAAGIWAVTAGGRAAWLIPATFLGILLAGAVLAWNGVTVPLVEAGIIGSILILGLMISFPRRIPAAAAVAVAGLFALFHGQAHGLEIPQAASTVLYGSGLLVSSGLLLLTGVLLGRWITSRDWQSLLGPGGMMLVAAAAWLAAGS